MCCFIIIQQWMSLEYTKKLLGILLDTYYLNGFIQIEVSQKSQSQPHFGSLDPCELLMCSKSDR